MKMNARLAILVAMIVTTAAKRATMEKQDNAPESVTCVTSEYQTGRMHNKTVFWNIKGWSQLLEFPPSRTSSEPHFSFPIDDPMFPAKGSLHVDFGRLKPDHVSIYAKFKSDTVKSYSMHSLKAIGRHIFHLMIPFSTWSSDEFYGLYGSHFVDDAKDNSTFVGFVPGYPFEDFHKVAALAKKTNYDVYLWVSISAVETQNLSQVTSGPCPSKAIQGTTPAPELWD